MNRTAVAALYILTSGIIGAAAALVFTARDPAPVTPTPPLFAEPAGPFVRHVVGDYRVAVTFPDRFEFDYETEGEVHYSDAKTGTEIVFLVTRLRDGARFDDILEAMERSFGFHSVVERVEQTSPTRAELTTLKMFREVSEIAMFVGEDCWGNPLLVRALHIYDRTTSPEEVWLTQNDPDFPQFEFAYRCPR